MIKARNIISGGSFSSNGRPENKERTKEIEAAKARKTQITTRQRVKRPMISWVAIEHAVKEIEVKLGSRLAKKGFGSYASKHEIYGILMEEVREFEEAVHLDKDGIEPVAQEMMDIAVTCLFGLACIRAGVITK